MTDASLIPAVAALEAPILGHVALNVRSLEVSVPFYCDVLQLRLRRIHPNDAGARTAFLAFGANDHDLALVELGASALPNNRGCTGLSHIAFRIGREINALNALGERLARLRVACERTRNHGSRPSIYFSDPEDIPLEAYVELDQS